MCESVSEQRQPSSRESFKRVEGHSSLKLLKDGVSPRERPELALGRNPDQVSPDPGLGSNIHSSVSNGWTLQLGVVEGKGRNSAQVHNRGSGTDSLLTKQKLDEAKMDRTPTVADGLSDSQSSIVELPSQTSEPIAIGDVNVMKASVDSGFAYLGVNVINLVKYPTYLTCSVVSLSLYPVKFRCCE